MIGYTPKTLEHSVVRRDGRETVRRVIPGAGLNAIDASFIPFAALKITVTQVSIGAGGSSGTATVPAGSTLIGWIPTGLSPAAGQSYVTISTISISGTTVTVTTTANVGNSSSINVITMV